jgi:uncharacterized membrane protein YczE
MTGDARWFVFKPKIPIWVNFGWPKIGMLIYFLPTSNILQTFWIFFIIWCILCSFGTFFPVLVSCTEKNLAALAMTTPMISA